MMPTSLAHAGDNKQRKNYRGLHASVTPAKNAMINIYWKCKASEIGLIDDKNGIRFDGDRAMNEGL